MPSSVGAAHQTSDMRRPQRSQQPWQRPHDRESGRADRLGRVAVDAPDLDLVLPHNAAGLDDGAHDIAAQASAAWEAPSDGTTSAQSSGLPKFERPERTPPVKTAGKVRKKVRLPEGRGSAFSNSTASYADIGITCLMPPSGFCRADAHSGIQVCGASAACRHNQSASRNASSLSSGR